jgi:dinuclear metal center YbgI/SA1388 family protein
VNGYNFSPKVTMELRFIQAFLEEFAPLRLAESWDNVGLLVGDCRAEVRRIMTCLTVTPDVVEEALAEGADLIVTHHPLPFFALKRLTADTIAGRMLLRLIGRGVSVYSPHTGFDSAAEGINQRLAAGLGLRKIEPLLPHAEGQGAGRWGELDSPAPLAELARRVMRFLKTGNLQMVGSPDQSIRVVAVACGAADEFLDAARQAGADALLLGEARFHKCIEAEAWGLGLLLPGHFASERFAVEGLAEALSRKFSELSVWASRAERDPLRWVSL